MRGIAGTLALRTGTKLDVAEVRTMLGALRHRGASVCSLTNRPGSIFASCGGEADVFDEPSAEIPANAPAVVLDGMLFGEGSTSSVLPHDPANFTRRIAELWETDQERMPRLLRGQFAFALHDPRRNVAILARDRSGISPLFWVRRGDKLWFSSEIKALLAVGAARPDVDVRGLDQLFTFFAITGSRTCFQEVSAVPAGCFLKIQWHNDGSPATVEVRRYWDAWYPDRGEEIDGDESQMVAAFAERFEQSMRRRLQNSEPVASYLSGGLDSSVVLTAARAIKGDALETFTIGVKDRNLDESAKAAEFAALLQCPNTIVESRSSDVVAEFPKIVQAAESPVIVTSCTALSRLARAVSNHGCRFALTGEGADEILAGHAWFKVNRFANMFDFGDLRISNLGRAYVQKLFAPSSRFRETRREQRILGGPNAYHDLYSTFSLGRVLFYSDAMWERLGGFSAYDDLDLNVAGMKRWDPLNRSLYLSHHVMLPGLLLNHKGDRPAAANGVRTLYPFLDEDLVEFVSSLHPRWKLRGLRQDKVLLRKYAATILPENSIKAQKVLFKAPLPRDFFSEFPSYARQLLSPESLRKTGYFDPRRVDHFCRHVNGWWNRSIGRSMVIRQGLIGVLSTQLWHHLYVDASLCELPSAVSRNTCRAA